MKRSRVKRIGVLLAMACVLGGIGLASAQQQPQPQPRGATSYAPVDLKEPFATVVARMKAAKPGIEKAHADLLAERYDLADRPARRCRGASLCKRAFGPSCPPARIGISWPR
jgi:hypothetical protein